MNTFTYFEKNGIELVYQSSDIRMGCRILVPGIDALVKICSLNLPGEFDSDLLFAELGKELSRTAKSIAGMKASGGFPITPNLFEHEILIRGQYQKRLLICFNLVTKLIEKFNPVLAQKWTGMAPSEYFEEVIGYSTDSLFAKMDYDEDIKQLYHLIKCRDDDWDELHERIVKLTERFEEVESRVIQEVKEESNETGIVYLVGNEAGGILKIGITNNVKQRLANLQLTSPYELHVIKKKPGNIATERELKNRFKSFQMRGEWFTWDDSIIENF